MNKDTLIAKQQLEIEIQEQKDRRNKNLIKKINGKFINIGAPLNENILKMNNEQLKWCFSVLYLVNQLE